jgi:hypothetical protein
MQPDNTSQPLYQGSGWANIGRSLFFSTRATSPLGKITIWQDKIEVSVRLKNITLTKTEISNIAQRKVLFSNGIQFIHNRSDLSPFIAFGSHDLDKVISVLRQAGYPVTF